MSALNFTSGKFRAFDAEGHPLSGGKVETYAAGTSDPLISFSTSIGDISNTNPVILDANGEADIYLSGTYKIILKDSDDIIQWTIDNLQGSVSLLSTITATSVTSVSIAVSSKTFEIQSGKSFQIGGFVIITSDADPTNYMHGQITNYSGTTLIINVESIGGSGTLADWTISLSGPRGAAGATGASGSGSGDMLGANNLSDVANVANSRANLGLGSSAIVDVGTSANNVLQLDGAAKIPAVDGSQLTNMPFSSGVSQSDLNTSTGSIVYAGATIGDTKIYSGSFPTGGYTTTIFSNSASYVLPGGSYGFYPQTFFNAGPVLSDIRQRYITSSPPFDLGDGDVGGFIFVLLNSAGDIVSHYAADVPPWAYNGPTNIRADKVDLKNGKKYIKIYQSLSKEQILDGVSPIIIEEEITNKIKNADMGLIPHPFGVVPKDHRVVLLDPMSDITKNLINYQNYGGGEDVSEIIARYIDIDNNSINRNSPSGVTAVRFTQKRRKFNNGKLNK